MTGARRSIEPKQHSGMRQPTGPSAVSTLNRSADASLRSSQQRQRTAAQRRDPGRSPFDCAQEKLRRRIRPDRNPAGRAVRIVHLPIAHGCEGWHVIHDKPLGRVSPSAPWTSDHASTKLNDSATSAKRQREPVGRSLHARPLVTLVGRRLQRGQRRSPADDIDRPPKHETSLRPRTRSPTLSV
jgi:hypothetical protein